MFKDIFKLYPNEPLFTSPLSLNNKMISYDIEIEQEISNKVNIKTVKYVDEILSETLENKIDSLIDINSEIGQKIKNDQIESSTQTH